MIDGADHCTKAKYACIQNARVYRSANDRVTDCTAVDVPAMRSSEERDRAYARPKCDTTCPFRHRAYRNVIFQRKVEKTPSIKPARIESRYIPRRSYDELT